MYVGRYYFDKKWIASINRFRTVVDEYDETIYTEEALHRLSRSILYNRIKRWSKEICKLLGYNYQSSKWYEKSYSHLINYDEKKLKNKVKKDSKLLDKFKSLFE